MEAEKLAIIVVNAAPFAPYFLIKNKFSIIFVVTPNIDLYKMSLCLFSAAKYLLFTNPILTKIPVKIAILNTDADCMYSIPNKK